MDLRALAMGLIFSLMWSSAFATARIIVVDAPPLYALALRFLLSGLLAVGIARALGASWRMAPGQWRSVAIFGLLQNTAYLGLNFVAMQWVEASLAVIIAASMPLIVAALGWAFRAERLPPPRRRGPDRGLCRRRADHGHPRHRRGPIPWASCSAFSAPLHCPSPR